MRLFVACAVTLRILLDYRFFDGREGSGQRNYVIWLLEGFADVASDFRWMIVGRRAEPDPGLLPALDELKSDYVSLPPVIGRLASVRDRFRLERLAVQSSAALVHALHTSIPRSPKIRTVVTIYDLMLEIFPEYSKVVASRDHRQYRRGVEQFASAAICISDNTRNDLLSRWQVSPSKAHTVLLGLPPAATRGSDDAQREIGDYMLSPFNLEPRKNLATLLGAFKRFQSSNDRFKLVLFGRAGHNEQREREFWERASTLGIKAAVHLTGIVSDKELYGLYHGAKAFVFPSLYEGFGLPVLEAMRCGCPVIVHGGSAMQEIAGDAGICVDANDEKQLNAAMERLTNNPSDAKILARRALERSATFTAERMARETLEVYRSVLESR